MLQARRLVARIIGLVVLLGVAAACAPGITAIAPGGGRAPRATALVQTAASPGGYLVTPPTTPSLEFYPGPAPSATLDITQQFIVGLKATDAADMNLTEAARPTNAPPPPTPTFPVGAAPCRASDLQISDETQGATGTIVIEMQVTNISRLVCYLQGPPDIKLANQTGQPLDIVYTFACFLCNNVEPSGTALPAPTQTALAQDRLYGNLGLGPGEHLGATMLWNNWCQPIPQGGVKVQLTLSGTFGVVESPTDIRDGGRCDVPGAPSTLAVEGYSRIS